MDFESLTEGGLFSNTPFAGSDTLSDAIAEADEEDKRFKQEMAGGSSSTLPTVIGGEPSRAASASTGVPSLSSGGSSTTMPELPSVIPNGSGAPPFPTGIPAGRPPGYAVPGYAAPGSSNKAALSLLTCVGVGAGAGVYFKDVRGAAVGFLASGALINLVRGRAETASPDPGTRQDAVWTNAASLIGLGIAAYLGYNLVKERGTTR